ncbi:arsinothricin resistance N-acetyltransferase ArsN1 family B [Nitratireductor sp. XY-223]|uniref:arsinothricin resistance N-acetyltransferase ArsN1 family B n=1 Tax=Nitratireductor sp. XY-223 TaxID=2561926 RepID=UPI00197CEE49|nr:arsinothricin resistance N-acetyltransferase ArsN1 family B [Nitratireductor sp. XY-223]
MKSADILIRNATTGDAPGIRDIYAPIVEKTVISFEEAVPSVEDMARRIEDSLRTHSFLVAERNGAVIGYAYGGRHRERAAYRKSADVSAYVAEAARGQGVGRLLYTQLLGVLARGGFHAAFAGIALPNPASVGLHEAVGFEPVGIYKEVGFKFGEWHDVGWWQRILDR